MAGGLKVALPGPAPARRCRPRHLVFGRIASAMTRSRWRSILHQHRLHQRVREQVRLAGRGRAAWCAWRCSSAPRARRAGCRACSISTRRARARSPARLDELGQLHDRELLGELVEHAELARAAAGFRAASSTQRRVSTDVEVAAGLAALAVDRERLADHRLHAEAVERGAEHLVVVEPRRPGASSSAVSSVSHPVDDALVQVGGAQPPDAAGEVDVVRVVDLRAGGRASPAASGTAGGPAGRCGRSR